MLQAARKEAKRDSRWSDARWAVYNPDSFDHRPHTPSPYGPETTNRSERFRVDRSSALGMSLSRLAAGAVLLAAFAAPARAQHAEPLHIRNLNPLVAIFGLPGWDTLETGTRFGATLELANHYRLSQRGADLLVLDGETLRTTFALSHAFGSRWSAGIEWPYYHLSGGVLDDLIDGWHSAFNLPDGGRNNRPDGALLFVLGDRNAPFFRLDRPQSGPGDTQLKLAHSLGSGDRFIVEATLKLPTGDADMLTGSGSTDVGLTLLRSQPLPARARPAGYYWGVGLLHAGTPERIEWQANHWMYTGIVGGTWQPWRRFGLQAQLDFHSPFYDSPFEEIGATAIEATFGAWWRTNERRLLHFAVVEDLEVSTAPDVVLQMSANWRW